MASISVPCPKVPSLARLGSKAQASVQSGKISFAHVPNPASSLSLASSLRKSALSVPGWPRRDQAATQKVHALVNEVTAEKSSNSAPVVDTKSKGTSSKGKDETAETRIANASEISAFMTQVSDLVKLVDSRDIMELQMKQSDCELIIRKKEALQPVAPSPPIFTMPLSMPQAVYQTSPPATPAPAPASPAHPAPAPALPAPAKTSTSSHPPLKSPMAGTFYKCPAPGEPPFVKVGDKVQKGQVVCIIEAMKLMNEIEADQSGTVTEILVEDGKSVNVDTPLFVIAP